MIYLSQYSFQLIQLHPSYCLSSKIAQPAHPPVSDSIRALAELGPKKYIKIYQGASTDFDLQY